MSSSLSSSLSSGNSSPSFQVGDDVELKGLVGKAYLNGRVGKIVGPVDSSSGRYPVDLLVPWIDVNGPDKKKKNYHTLTVKPENLIQFIPFFDRVFEGVMFQEDRVSVCCDFCFVQKTSKDFKQCSRCKVASYCSIVCQHMHWKDHKMECKVFRQGRKSNNGDLAGNLDPRTEHRIRQERAVKCEEQGDLAGAEHERRQIIESGCFDPLVDNYNLANTLMYRCNDKDDERYHDRETMEEAIRQLRLATEKDFHPCSTLVDEEKTKIRSKVWSSLGSCLGTIGQLKEGMLDY